MAVEKTYEKNEKKAVENDDHKSVDKTVDKTVVKTAEKDFEKIATEILGGKKYSALDRATVERICSELAPRYPKRSDAIKAIKKELHIIYGAFLSNDCHAKGESLIRGYAGSDMHADKDFAANLMRLHLSTAERAGSAGEICAFAGEHIGPDDILFDIGCGFNPFSLPFYPNRPEAYTAFDICARTVDLINLYFEPLGSAYRARQLDAISGAPIGEAQVILMYKLFPLLERQRKGRMYDLLSTLDYRAAIVSFPTKSASGREKGMESFYSGMFKRGLPEGLTIADAAAFENEIFFVVIHSS